MASPKITTPVPEVEIAWAHRARQVLALAWLILAATVLGVGERWGSLTDLDQALTAGRINSVSVEGDGLENGATGEATQIVHWWAGGQHRITEVRVRTADPDDGTDSTDADDSSDTADRPMTITGSDVGEYLQDRHPQLLVTRSPQAIQGSQYLGWRLPTWLFLPGLAVYLGALALLIRGPEPWRATRWAWFWLFLNPIGTPLFLLLSGPTPLLPAPRRVERRLTGGWAFLLSLILPG